MKVEVLEVLNGYVGCGCVDRMTMVSQGRGPGERKLSARSV